MLPSLREAYLQGGAELDSATGHALHFGDAVRELRAARDGCVVVDRSDLTLLLARGPDLLGLLHRLSTGDVKNLTPGDGCPTVLTTPKGRIVERLFVQHLGTEGVLLVGERNSAGAVQDHLQRYTFSEDTRIEDLSGSLIAFGISGPLAASIFIAPAYRQPPRYGTIVAEFAGSPLWLLGHDCAAPDGFTAITAARHASSLWKTLTLAASGAGGRPAGDQAHQAELVLRGLPVRGCELTERYNPLEAGLWDAVSFSKGCYVGQEVVARLRTYDKISRSLLGVVFPPGAPVAVRDSPLFVDGRAVGTLTRSLVPPGWDHGVGLAYVKRREAGPGAEVRVGAPEGSAATLVALPFEAHTLRAD